VGKNVAVYVDVANIFYAAKAAGVDIDYVTLLKSAIAGRDFVRAYAYTGLDPENENQRNFHNFLARHGYKVVSKDIRKYGDGKVKANLDIELVVDMLKTARNLDIAVLISGDGDFAPAIRAVQEMGVRVEVISFRGNTSSDLIDVADLFTDITQIARVEKGSSRSGRRVAGDDEDLSMTEVPDKQTEGTGTRTRGRGRTRSREAEPVAVASRARSAAGRGQTGQAALVALPGERLAKAAAGTAAADDEAVEDEEMEVAETAAGAGETAEDGSRRRRRRRGGRRRGRGRGDEAPAVEVGGYEEAGYAEEVDVAPSPSVGRAPRPAAFGSVWDSQIGMPSGPSGDRAPSGDDEDFEEPEIPEYLIAEQRRGARGGAGAGRGRGGPRGGRSAYVAAMERERYGGGRSTRPAGIDRYGDPSRQGGRYGGRGPARPDRQPGRPSSEPWSEVPPELEEMLRAQMSSRRRDEDEQAPDRPEAVDQAASPAGDAATTGTTSRRATTSRRSPRARAVGGAEAAEESGAAAAPKARRSTRRPTATSTAKTDEAATEEAPKRRRTTTRKATTADDTSGEASSATAAPARRRTRKSASPTSAEPSGSPESTEA
jgi:uncharacterized LabA/DUF88 family protein